MNEATEVQPSLIETMSEAYDELAQAEETATEVEAPQAAIPDPEATAEAGAEDETEAEPEADDQTATDETDDDSQALEAPQHWSDDDRAMFTTLDAAGQEFLLRRHRETEADYTRKTQEVAEQRKALEPLEQVLAPYRNTWSTQGVSDAQAVERLLQAHVAMVQNPVQTFQYLAQTYGVDLSQFAPQGETHSDYTDPATQALQQELNQLKAQIQQQGQQATTAVQNQYQQQIDSFANAADAEGSPLHPHFEAVQNRMAALITAERQLGDELTLQQAYDQAVKLDPAIEAQEKTAAQRKAEQELERQAAARAKKAKRAAKVNITGTGSSAGRQAQPENIKEALSEAWSQLGGS